MAGRPKYPWTPEIEDEICTRIANGEALHKICKDDHLPTQPTVFKQLHENPQFVEKYARARESQAEKFLDEIIQISDDCTDDVEKIILANGTDTDAIKHSAITRARLRVDARKWAMSKLAPKKYGDRTAHDVTISTPTVRVRDYGGGSEPEPTE